MPAKSRWVRFGRYETSGVVIRGRVPVAIPTSARHVEHAFWLTAMLESPTWGTVQSWDGAGISGGPLHSTMTFHRNLGAQGRLPKLLRAIQRQYPSLLTPIVTALAAHDWVLAASGHIVDVERNRIVSGQELRNVIAPPSGQVPKEGPEREQADRWAIMLHQLLSNSKTWPVQAEDSIEYLLRGHEAIERQAYARLVCPFDPADERSTVEELLCDRGPTGIPYEGDLAMSVYHCFSVNAPSRARAVLRRCLLDALPPKGYYFARHLILSLGKDSYGNWAHKSGGGGRYDKCRKAAMRSKLWPPKFFTKGALMPLDPGGL